MSRLLKFLRFVVADFGPLIAFWVCYAPFGLRGAIAGTVVYIAGDVVVRRIRHRRFTRIYLLSSGLAVVFGTIDLLSAAPFMLKYEAVVTNIATGIFFAAGALGKKPLIQEFAEQRQGAFPDRTDVHRFFQLFTFGWALYFFLKAAVYFAIGAAYPLAEALALRSVIGGISLAIMLVASIALGRPLFFLMRRLHWLPTVEEPAAAPGPA